MCVKHGGWLAGVQISIFMQSFCIDWQGFCCTVSTGSAEINRAVIFRNSRNIQGRMFTAVSFKVHLVLHVALWVREVPVHVSQVPQSSVFFSFVPKDALKNGYAVRAVDRDGFAGFRSSETRRLDDLVIAGSSCGQKRNKQYENYNFKQ